MVGKTLGHYEILEQVGVGGMGEVYRARDVRLDRIVAVKVLPPHFAENLERRQRFEREARTISSLSHPNICTLHDLGQEGDTHYLVMEFLEGETLAERLRRGPLPMSDVLRHGADIAEALDRAHRSGIVHRDLKPGNVMLTPTGVKLLDFGLAKIAGLGPETAHTLTQAQTEHTPNTPLTAEGTILGTFQYMAPEQLEGAEADARSDLFALGAVLYEMATGQKAFTGKSQASLIGAILHQEPTPVSTLQPLTPPAFEHVVRRCLAKDPDDRWQSARDVASQLRWVADESSRAGVPAAVSSRRRSRARMAWIVAALASVAALVLAGVLVSRRPPEPRVVRFTIPVPEDARSVRAPQISPDGRAVAFGMRDASGMKLRIRNLDDLEAHPAPGGDGVDRAFWSPDSRSLAFFTDGKLRKVAVSGGPVQTLCDAPRGDAGDWGETGDILFDGSLRDAISRVSSAGGLAQAAIARDTTRTQTFGWPKFLPDHRHFLCIEIDPDVPGGDEFRLFCGDLKTGKMTALGSVGSRVEYAAPGWLLSVSDRTLVAQPFDAKRLELSGEPVPLAEGVPVNAWGDAPFSVSPNGTLVYRSVDTVLQRLVWRDRTGRVLEELGEPGDYDNLALAPDGNRIALERVDPETDNRDIWILDAARGTSSRLTFDAAQELHPTWSPDGRWVVYTGATGPAGATLFRTAASGAGRPESLAAYPRWTIPLDWSRDGSVLALTTFEPETGVDLLTFDPEERSTTVVLASPFTEVNPVLSPDGRWLAYASDESGRMEVYVRPYPDLDGKWQVSTAGGNNPRWRADGKELLYLEDRTLMAVEVSTGEGFRVGSPETLFEVSQADQFAVSDDGQRTLWLETVENAEPPPFVVVLNWSAQFEGR